MREDASIAKNACLHTYIPITTEKACPEACHKGLMIVTLVNLALVSYVLLASNNRRTGNQGKNDRILASVLTDESQVEKNIEINKVSVLIQV